MLVGGKWVRVPGTRFRVPGAIFLGRFGDERTTTGVGKRSTARGRCPVPAYRCWREGKGGGCRVRDSACPEPFFWAVLVRHERRGGEMRGVRHGGDGPCLRIDVGGGVGGVGGGDGILH